MVVSVRQFMLQYSYGETDIPRVYVTYKRFNKFEQ